MESACTGYCQRYREGKCRPENLHPLRKAYGDFVNRYPIETMVTLRFTGNNWSERSVQKAALEFVRNLAKGRKTRVAAVGVFNCRSHPHLHLCLFDKHHSLGSLADKEAQNAWKYGSAKVSPVYDAGGGCYIGRNITPNDMDKSEFIAVSLRQLNKAALCPEAKGPAWLRERLS